MRGSPGRSRMAMRFLWIGGLAMLVSAISPIPGSAQAAKGEIRALWVTRWDYRTPDDVRRIVANAKWAGFNRLFFQVRGAGTCFFPSSVEPWTWRLSGDVSQTGTDPGWDPLALAISEAHRHGLELHAYLNVLPAWKNEQLPPKSCGQVYVCHPDWVMVDAKGRRMSTGTNKFYAFLNPARKDVRDYLVNLFADAARRYCDLDGIHLDYIRYPGEIGDFSHDAESLRQFRAYTGGKTPEQAPDKWLEWRGRQINRLLAEIAAAIRQQNNKLEISASVVANYPDATRSKAQYSLGWPDLGLVDTLVPMAYHYSTQKYTEYLGTFLGKTRPKHGEVIIGIWPAPKWRTQGYTHRKMLDQITAARRRGADGIAIFAYSRFFPNHSPNSWAKYLKEKCFGVK